MPDIKVKNLTVTYIDKKKNETVAVRGFSARFDAGTLNVVMGFSGCGKTTLLKAIAGFFAFDGYIYFDGRDADTIPTRKRNLAYVSQDYVLYPSLTVFDNIAFPLKTARLKRDEVTERVKAIAETFGLTDCLTRLPKYLSGGQQQRVAIARAMVKHPNLILMDEPLSNVDTESREMLRRYIRHVQTSEGVTVIYVTHDYREALELADRIYVMDEGQLVFEGTPDEVRMSENETVALLRQ